MAAAPLSTDARARRLAALEASGWNQTAAAKALNISRTTLRDWVRENKLGPIHDEGDGFRVTSKSTLRKYDDGGEVVLEWTKTAADQKRQAEIAREIVAALSSEIEPAKKTPAPRSTTGDVMVALILADLHIGMYSWREETGADWDRKLAQQLICSAVDRLIASAPAADECFIAQLGDFFHMDSSTNTTAKGTRLDVDTRFAQVVRVGIQTMRYAIDGALKKFKRVRIRNVAGNHDTNSSIILTEALRGYYANEPRVIIEGSPKPFWTFRFENNLVGLTHGHGGRPDDYAGVLAVEGRDHWSHCEYKYVWHGHFHHKKVIEKLGVISECFRTVAARDHWHASEMYGAGREMVSIVLHKDFGEIERHTASLQRIRSAA